MSAQTGSENAASNRTAEPLETKLEVVMLPVSDVERAKRFYEDLACGSTPTSATAPTGAWCR